MDSIYDIAIRVASVSTMAARKKKPAKVNKPARKVSKPKKNVDFVDPTTEYSCQLELSLSVDFEGNVSQKQLLDKLKRELMASIETGIKVTARDMRIQASNVSVRPLKFEVSALDQTEIDELDADF